MVLKSLLLQGFKSFPDKTEIRFLGGLTAIVGPNGSGKSNISDAIRWVLGEQSSRSLRGAKMEDVIFGGTVRRGAVGFAEVSLILNNENGIFRSEFTEIMVTRRYYRSGESEYYINKKHCKGVCRGLPYYKVVVLRGQVHLSVFVVWGHLVTTIRCILSMVCRLII